MKPVAQQKVPGAKNNIKYYNIRYFISRNDVYNHLLE